MAIDGKEFYKKFSALCEMNFMPETTACAKAGLARGSFGAWKRGAAPTEKSIYKICALFGVTKDYFESDTPVDSIGPSLDGKPLDSEEISIIRQYRETGKSPVFYGLEARFIDIYTKLDFNGKTAVMLEASKQYERMENKMTPDS